MSFWHGKRVWLSGHTGFQGAWLAVWLKELGAEVYGFALEPEERSLFQSLSLEQYLDGHLIADIRNAQAVRSSFYAAHPDIVFHLAAQNHMNEAIKDPRTTWDTNVLGTLNVLDVVQTLPSVRVVQVITSDHCYENFPPYTPKREDDALGGTDPYGASKAAVELLVRSYQSVVDVNRVSIATCRAGNMIGPGDWSNEHLVPAVIRAIQEEVPVRIRCPQAARPWQAVLDPLAGYLKLAESQWEQPQGFGEAWNFGPSLEDCHTVRHVVDGIFRHWTYSSTPALEVNADAPWDEPPFIQLDALKAWGCLAWTPRFSFEDAVRWTAQGYEQCLNASPEELLKWMRASILSYDRTGQAVQEIVLSEQHLGYGSREEQASNRTS